MMRYDVKYSEERDGPKRHIYSGINNEMTFHLPSLDKPGKSAEQRYSVILWAADVW